MPLSPWQIDSILPEEYRLPDISKFEIGVIRPIGNYHEIWLLNQDSWNDIEHKESETRFILIYRTDTKTWRKIPAKIEGEYIFVDTLYILEDGSIWGKTVWTEYIHMYQWPILSRFNEHTQRFEGDFKTNVIPHGRTDLKLPGTRYLKWGQVLIDVKGIFWILGNDQVLYRYEPSSGKVSQQVDLSEYGSVDLNFISHNNQIFFESYPIPDKVFYFETQENTVKSIQFPRMGSDSFTLADHSGRLWLADAYGWIDQVGNPVILHPHRLRYWFEMDISQNWRYYGLPDPFLETSDGRIWFQINRASLKELRSGMAWFDPKNEVGCWFTSVRMNIAEDSDSNIWLFTDGYLYKYSLE